jgi:probable F420-dependent oxidoreductase
VKTGLLALAKLPPDQLVETVQTAEAGGFSHFWHSDEKFYRDPWVGLTLAALKTRSILLGTGVVEPYARHPALLAMAIASLDEVSDGRAILGIGAGGTGFPPLGVQRRKPATALREAITVIRGLFGEGSMTFRGRHYTITGMDGRPKPVQKPHPPFLLGGTRERMLRLAAREGDIVGLDLRQDRASLPDAFPARMDERVGWVRDEAGQRFDRLELSVLRLLGPVAITDHALRVARDVARDLEQRTGLVITPDDVFESPYSLIGTVDQLVDKMIAARERWGINSYLLAWFDEPELPELASLVERLAGA